MLNTSFANDVRQTLDQFRRSVDQMFENDYGRLAAGSSQKTGDRSWTFNPVFEMGWTDSKLNLRAILPGVEEKNIRVSVQNNQLVLEGERTTPEEFGKDALTQLAYGRFYSVLTLPSGLDVDSVECHLHHGVLDIHIPILEQSKPRQIQIKSGGHQAKDQKTINA